MPEENFAEIVEVAVEETAHELRGHGALPRWIEWASLSTMIMALIAAVGGFLEGSTGDEAVADRQKQIADLIERNRMEVRSELLLNRVTVIEASGKPVDPSLLAEAQAAQQAANQSSERASGEVAESRAMFQTDGLFAIGATILSLAITLTGMAVIVRQQLDHFFGQ